MTLELVVRTFLLLGLQLLGSPIVREFNSCSVISFNISWITFFLIGLRVYVFILAVSISTKEEVELRNKIFMNLHILILLLIVLFFVSRRIFSFYILLELSVIPIFIVIIGWGYQRERLGAARRLFFYTITASLPLLFRVIWFKENFCHSYFLRIDLRVKKSFYSQVLFFYGFITAFAVKLPIYLTHSWLPKAHVEAPVIGSIILAAILLKLGGYGLFLIIPLVFSSVRVKLLIAVSVIGLINVNILCIRLVDMKSIIAYSSVAHMRIVIFPLILGFSQGVWAAFLIMMAHGFVSSSLFFLRYVRYKRRHRRSLLFNKGILIWGWRFGLVWLLVLAFNIGVPPSTNFFRELIAIMTLVNYNWLNSVFIFVGVMAGAAYTLILYRSFSQGQHTLIQRSRSFTILEILVRFSHIIWALLLVSLLIIL